MLTTAQGQTSPTAQTSEARLFLSHAGGQDYRAAYNADAETLTVQSHGQGSKAVWYLRRAAGRLLLGWPLDTSPLPATNATLAAIEAAFAAYPAERALLLEIPEAVLRHLRHTGVVIDAPEGPATVHAELFWQQPHVWLPSPRPLPYPQQPLLSEGRRHPRRPPRPEGTVYRRYIPWLESVLSFRVLDLELDLERFNRWMNDPVVARFWEEQGDLKQHRKRLENTLQHPGVVPLIGCIDGKPFGYFETYWAREDRIGAYYEAGDHDRGWHVLIGEAEFRGSPYVAAWMPSISHYLFLDDCRTQRLVIEPRVDNAKMLSNLARCGYAHVKAFDFPHKRAMLGMQLREHFFNERCWVPLPPHPGSVPQRESRFTP